MAERVRVLFIFRVLLFHLGFIQSALCSSNFTDQSALLAFKSSINYPVMITSNWTNTTNFCNWIGVLCSKKRQRVTSLNLSYMGFQGTISPYIGNLSFLISLDLSNNSFYGFLPQEIGNLYRLRKLVLPFNQLEGNIPPSLQYCKKLEFIDFTLNSFSGNIPKGLGFLPELHVLYLTWNNLSGVIPPEIFNISSLNSIDLTGTGTGLSGSLPLDLCDRWPDIREIFLMSNSFSGELPSRMYNCQHLVVLVLSYNRFYGSIPADIGSLKLLEELYLGGNSLTGTIPSTIGNMTMLRTFYIEENYIKGSIPSELGSLTNLFVLNFDANDLTGEIPREIFNISTLSVISFASNDISGNIPSGDDLWLPNIQKIFVGSNRISGNVPSYFSNFSNLFALDIGGNLLTGPIPKFLGNLKSLKFFALDENQLTGEPGDPELSFLSALSNCRLLEKLILQNNPLHGRIPDSIGNFSASLQLLIAHNCQLQGEIPKEIGFLKGLTWIDFSSNNLIGNIPSAIGSSESLQRLYLDDNKIKGIIPKDLCQLRQLGELSLTYNNISGPIPNCIGNLSQMQKLNLSSNRLTSSIPINLWNLDNLLFLSLSFNSLTGDLPVNMRKLNVIHSIDLSWNRISGNIPSIIGAFEGLSSLNLSRNSFQGSIPESFGNLKALDFLDLSHNNLSGMIPKSLQALSYLKYLNLSFNKLSGEIPSGGPFLNFSSQSFLGNKALCGKQVFDVPPCRRHSTSGSRMKQLFLKYILPAIASIILVVSLLYAMRKRRRSNVLIRTGSDLIPSMKHRMISYLELVRATNNFCESTLLGVGSFASVYKGILHDGTTVAIKVLNLQVEGALRSFDVECKALRTIRHRNLVKVISACSNLDFRALVLQFMSNGSLDKWLYSHNYCLDLLQRVNIMVDVALALEYLHHHHSEPVVHCDLKPSNILLDEDMVAHVADFGISKILIANKSPTQTKTLGTVGYIAPEYGSEGKVSTKGDVYSFGIILMEIITRKKPTDEMFVEELSLRKWVTESLANETMEAVVDDNLLNEQNGHEIGILFSILQLGLECCDEFAEERIDMKDVVVKLNKIKLSLLH